MSKILLLTDPLNYDKRKVIEVPAGMTIAEMRVHKDIKKIIDPVEKVTVSRMGEIIPFENYDTDIIHPNDYLMVLPKCGDDDVVKVVAIIGLYLIAGPTGVKWGVTTFGAGTAGAAFWGTVATIAIIVGGGMLINSMGARPKAPSLNMANPDAYSQAYGWNPITTQQQGLKIARVYGKILVQGNLIEGYRIVTGDETNLQTLYANIGIGEGPIYIPVVDGTLKVNDQTIENFNDVYYSTRYGNMIQETIGWSQRCHFPTTPFIKVTNSDGAKIHETKGNLFDSLIIDVSFPGGLYDGTGAGLANHTVNITLEVKKASASTWITIITEDITADVNTPVIRSYNSEDFISGVRGEKYQVRLAKNTADKNDPLWGDELYLDTVKEITHEEFQQPGLASVNLNVLATGQLSGSLRASWITLGKYVRRWTGAAWEIVYNNSLAWVIYDVFTQPVFTGYHSPWLDLKLMLNFEGVDTATETIDESPKGHNITFGGSAEIDTGEYKFGSSSVILNGTDSYLQIANDGRSFNICHNVNENWTIDFFVKFADHIGNEYIITQFEDANNRWLIEHIHGSGFTFFLISGGAIVITTGSGGEITDTDWHHIAMCKVGNMYAIYKDGTQVNYVQDDSTDIILGDLLIGQYGAGLWFDGHIDHFRIIQNNLIFEANPNVGLTDTIIVPTAAYTDPGNSYVDAEHEAYADSKLDLPSFTVLETWCDASRVNPVNFSIESISKAANAIIVVRSEHNKAIGDRIVFRNVSINGMTEISDETTANIIQIIDDYTLVVDIDSSAYSTYELLDKLLYDFEGADGDDFTIDLSPQGHNIGPDQFKGTAQIDTAQKKWGNSSFESGAGAAGIVYLPTDTDDWNILENTTDDWTIDYWVRHKTHVGSEGHLMNFWAGGNYWKIRHTHGTGLLFNSQIASAAKIDTGVNGEITDTDWHHIALCKVGADIGLYLDETQVGYDLMVAGDAYDYGPQLDISNEVGFQVLDGHIDDLRIRKSNIFSANPVVGLTNTITEPTGAHTSIVIGTIEEYLPRFAFNGVIDTDKNLWETAIHLCKLCRAVPYMKGSKIAIAINKSTSSSYMFNMANIDAGSFKEFFLPKNERAYEITSQFRNKAADYKRQGSPIPNPNILNTSNRITQNRFGITDKTTVDDLSTFELLENEYIDLAVQFRGDVDAIPVKIGDVVDFTHDVSNWHKIGQLSEHYTGSGQIRRAINGATAIITIDGKVNFVDADFDGGSLTYKVKVKMSDDSMELKTITGHTVVDGEHSILVAGPFDMTPKPGDMWSAGQENLQTRTFRVSNMRTTQILKSDILLTQYVETCFEND